MLGLIVPVRCFYPLPARRPPSWQAAAGRVALVAVVGVALLCL